MNNRKNINSKKLLLLVFALFLISQNIKSGTPLLQNFDSITSEIDRISLYKGTEAHKLVDNLYNISDSHPDKPELYIRALHKEIFLNNIQGKVDTTLISKVKISLASLNGDKYLFEKALLHYTLAIGYSNMGNFADAFLNGLHALELFKSIEDSRYIVKSLIALGNICASIKSDTMAEDYYTQGLSYASDNEEVYHSILPNIYMIWSHSDKRREEAIDSLENLIPVFEAHRDTGLLTVTNLNIGVCYQVNREYDKAYQYFEKMSHFIQYIDNNKLLFSLFQNLGNYYYSVKEYENAFSNYEQAKKIALEESNPELLSHVYYRLSDYYSALEKNDSAYYYLKNYQILNRQLINNAKSVEAYRAYISVFLESTEDKLKIAEQEIIIRNRRFIVALLSTAGAAILVVFLLVFIRQKKQQMHLLKENLDLKIREITSYSLLLSDKNNVLKQISEITTNPAMTEREIEDVNSIIKKNLNVEEDWENFMLHFNKVHPDFFDKLKSHCGHLTKNNLRLCAYFRIGINTKEVAQILNISPDTIKVNRHRLKKKLGLGEEESLDEFLRNI